MVLQEELKVVLSQGWLVVARPSYSTFGAAGAPAVDSIPGSESQPRLFSHVAGALAS